MQKPQAGGGGKTLKKKKRRKKTTRGKREIVLKGSRACFASALVRKRHDLV